MKMPSGYCSATRKRSMSRLLMILIRLSITLSCLITCNGFTRPMAGMSNRASVKSPTAILMPSASCRSRWGTGTGQQSSLAQEKIIQHGISCCCKTSSGYCSSSKSSLFPQRKKTLLMASTDDASDDSSNEVSDEKKNPLVKAWLCFRKLLARLFALLLKPFQLLKSVLPKVDKDEKMETKKLDDDEGPVPEGVAITEVENMAAVEDEEKAEVVSEAVVEKKEEEAEEAAAEVVVAEEATATEEETASSETIAEPATATTPPGPRAATTASVDLTGNWTLLVTDTFTSQYENYLRKLGQPMLVRTVALTVIGSTKEETIQSNDGQHLYIRGMNVRGSWERTLEASEQIVDEAITAEADENHNAVVQGHELKPMTTADGEQVSVASWWEKEGTVHHSWVVGGKKYGGGDFENKRYLTDDGNILVCESTFHPRRDVSTENGGEMMDGGREDAFVKWRFLRDGAMYGDAAVEFPNIFDVLKKDDEDQPEDDGDTESKLGVIVGDIMDNVAIPSEDEAKTNELPVLSATDIIEEEIERESWVPPSGDRWAISSPTVDLSGKWKLIITEKFKTDYEGFLQSLGQPLIVRGAAVVLIGNTREETRQSDGGRSLYIKGVNAKGIWERTLTSSGSDFDTMMKPNADGSYTHIQVPIVTADSEKVVAESWWEEDGTTHMSWTYGVTRYGGGSFESKRYLENDGNVYVCESTFHPNDSVGRGASYLKWKFLREGAAFMVTDK